MPGALKRAIAQRIRGDKPSVLQAAFAALTAGAATAVLTYRLMRS